MHFEREAEFARRIAKIAGENAARIRRGGVAAEIKADDSPVTIADKENERIIREAIELEFPDDGILGEEGTARASRSGRRWIIDPIDGTRDFVRGNRFWCVLIALEQGAPEDNATLAGVAHFPLLDETYWATSGGGAYLGEERLQASRVARMEEAVFLPNGLSHPPAAPHLQTVMNLAQRTWSFRAYGGALDACMIAAGQAELWFEPKVAPWDLAPLRVIAEEAGARFFALDGSRSIYRGSALVCAPGLEAEVKAAFSIPAGGGSPIQA